MLGVLLTAACLFALQAYSAEPTYVIFTGNDDDEDYPIEVWHVDDKDSWDPEKLRYPLQWFTIRHRDYDIAEKFLYLIRVNGKRDMQVRIEPRSFLSSIECIDLDVELYRMNKEQLQTLVDRLHNTPELYFIDRNDFTDSTLRVVPVWSIADMDRLIIVE